MHTLAQLRAGELAGLKRLDLSCGLSEFPEEIFQLADSLEILNLSGNALSSLPEDLHRLTQLRVVFCSDNRFSELPASLGQCQQLSMIAFKANPITRVPAAALPPKLRWLTLTDNRITELPDELGHCVHLQKLLLAGNRLQTLPETLKNCQQLELVRIAANCLTALPDWLLRLPRLAWLAYAGNPLSALPEPDFSAHTNTTVEWSSLTIQQLLGEGASGVIKQALWRRPDNTEQSVAVKLYKGDVTSDGSPLHEMHACISAGEHPNLIKIEGQLNNHPDEQAGLVMALIDPQFANLAGPPSLSSCSRDIYPPREPFSSAVIQRIAGGIAAVGAHLHRQGLCHGDLYAHNIMINDAGDCLLGDFGAASFHAPDDSEQSRALQRIEVRAFGILLGELLERRVPGEDLPRLETLRDRCKHPNVLARPGFNEIVQVLQGN